MSSSSSSSAHKSSRRDRDHKRRRSRSRSRSRSPSYDSDSSSASPASDSGGDNGDRKRRKHKHKSKKHKKHKKHKSSKPDKEERARLKEARRIVRRAEKAASSSSSSSSSSSKKKKRVDDPSAAFGASSNRVTGMHGREQIGADDYFRCNTEYRVWLQRVRGRYFDDMTTDDAKRVFAAEFVAEWNAGTLAECYYKGIDNTLIPKSKLTRHTWGFAKQLDAGDRDALTAMRDDVDSATHKTHYAEAFNTQQRVERDDRGRAILPDRFEQHKKSAAAAAASASSSADRTADREERRAEHKRDRKSWQRRRTDTLDELVPRADAGSHAARQEKRQQVNAATHGRGKNVARADDFVTADATLMGNDGGAELQRLRAQRDRRADVKQTARSARLDELQAKEDERNRKFLASLPEQYRPK